MKKPSLFAALALAFGTVASAAPAIFVDPEGVMRWSADKQEVRLFGANYSPFSAGDYRLAVRTGSDIKKLIDADLGHFARMGWDGMRLSSWGDWESADAKGNLVENVHTELMDYLIAKAKERDITMLLSPIVTYPSSFADGVSDPSYKATGFSSLYPRKEMGVKPEAVAAQVNYVRQVLNHVNPYTGLALKDDPAIPMIEMINEPEHHPQDLQLSISYINTLVDAVRSTGSQQITFHNYSQDYAIADALAKSKVQGIDFGWYPSGLVSGRTLKGSYLSSVDDFPALRAPSLAKKPRIVYEFDQADLLTGYMYPAMARTFRSVGAQFAAIFSYDMLDTAPYNLSWQTHFINLVHTPRKAVSAVISGEAMRRLPRLKSFGSFAESKQFGDFSLDDDADTSLLNADDAYMNAGDSLATPRRPTSLKRVVGLGSSPLVNYEGSGAYFLDKVADGVWRLEVYPNALLVSDPYAQPVPGKVVSRLYFNAWPMAIHLPDLGAAFTATPLVVPANSKVEKRQASAGVFSVEPGVWLLSNRANPDLASLPAKINRVGMREYHVNPPQTYDDLIQNTSVTEHVAGQQVRLSVRLASGTLPDQLDLALRPAGRKGFDQPLAMRRVRGFDYVVVIDSAAISEGDYEFVVSLPASKGKITFPGATAGQPGLWPFAASDVWRFTVTAPQMPLEIFNPKRDSGNLSAARAGETDRLLNFKLGPGETSGTPALTLGLEERGGVKPELNAGVLYIGDAIAARRAGGISPTSLSARLKASNGKPRTLEVFLVEKDGSSWRAPLVAGLNWGTVTVDLNAMTFSRSVLAPTPYPGLGSYWRQGPASRARGKIQPWNIERLELRVSRQSSDGRADDAGGVDIASVQLHFDGRKD
ncbi:glycoside hydrolase 5 family protein [Duganella sp. PWIR1]